MERDISKMKDIISDFFKTMVTQNDYNPIYNEISLQLELGCYLRKVLGDDYRVDFERNVDRDPVVYDGKTKVPNPIKKELDIYIYSKDGKKRSAIELKYPRNKQHPVTLYKFTEDIKFMEQIHDTYRFTTYCLSIASDELFFASKNNGNGANSKLYNTYRTKDFKNLGDFKGECSEVIYNQPFAITYKDRQDIILRNTYNISWNLATDSKTNRLIFEDAKNTEYQDLLRKYKNDIYYSDGYEGESKPIYFYLIEIND